MDGIKSFEYVTTISDTNSFSEAAESLGIAQPALSRYIVKLEKELGVELFDRSSLPIILTEAGRYYVEAGRQILAINHQLKKRLDDVKAHKNLEIRIGTGPSRAPALLPFILEEFSGDQPDVKIKVSECRTAELAERLKDGKVDLIITFYDHTTENFGMEELFEERVELAVSKKHIHIVEENLEKGVIDIRKLTLPFVSLHEGQQLRNALEILGFGGIKPQYTSDYQESAMALVKHGLGVALTPSYWKLVDKNAEIAYYPVAIPEDLTVDQKSKLLAVINRRVGIFYRKEQFLSDAEKAYIASAKKVCAAIV